MSAIQDLRALRDNINQSQLAELCGMKQSAVCRLEKPEYGRWNFQTLWRIAESLDARWQFILEPREAVIEQYAKRDRSYGPPPFAISTARGNALVEANRQDPSRIDEHRKTERALASASAHIGRESNLQHAELIT